MAISPLDPIASDLLKRALEANKENQEIFSTTEKLLQLNLPIERRKYESSRLAKQQRQSRCSISGCGGEENTKNIVTPLTTKIRDRHINVGNSSIDQYYLLMTQQVEMKIYKMMVNPKVKVMM